MNGLGIAIVSTSKGIHDGQRRLAPSTWAAKSSRSSGKERRCKETSRIGRMPVAILAVSRLRSRKAMLSQSRAPPGTPDKEPQSLMMDIKGPRVVTSTSPAPTMRREMRAHYGPTARCCTIWSSVCPEGYKKVLMIVGVGYKGSQAGNKLMLLYLGHSLMSRDRVCRRIEVHHGGYRHLPSSWRFPL